MHSGTSLVFEPCSITVNERTTTFRKWHSTRECKLYPFVANLALIFLLPFYTVILKDVQQYQLLQDSLIHIDLTFIILSTDLV